MYLGAINHRRGASHRVSFRSHSLLADVHLACSRSSRLRKRGSSLGRTKALIAAVNTGRNKPEGIARLTNESLFFSLQLQGAYLYIHKSAKMIDSLLRFIVITSLRLCLAWLSAWRLLIQFITGWCSSSGDNINGFWWFERVRLSSL